jgi:HTH-type transcriptional regulator/antitoxin HigA
MEGRGWIENSDADLLDLQMMRFFDANRIEDVPLVGVETFAHAAKKTGYEEITGTQMVWLHRVRKIAKSIDAPRYDQDKLTATLPDIRAHMFDLEDLSNIPRLLLDCGVRTVFVEKLPAGKIDGVCTWLGDEPVIGLSLRLNRPDNLCFVLRHEIEHVLQGDGKDVGFSAPDTFEPDRDPSELPDEERRADEAAAEFLVPQDRVHSFLRRKGQWISEEDVLAFAARHHIHPSIVVGQIQHHRFKKTGDKKEWRFLRRYLTTKVDGFFSNWSMLDGWGHVAEVGL